MCHLVWIKWNVRLTLPPRRSTITSLEIIVDLKCSRSVAPFNTPQALIEAFCQVMEFWLFLASQISSYVMRRGSQFDGWRSLSSLRAQLFRFSSFETRVLVRPYFENTPSARDSKSSKLKLPFILFCRCCQVNNPLSIFLSFCRLM